MPISFWKKVDWTDDSKFNIRGSVGRERVWRKKGESLKTDFMRSTVMVWGAMVYGGIGTMEFIEGIMRSDDYKLILERNLTVTTKKCRMGRNFVSMHDNDPKHKSKLITGYLKEKGV